MAIHQRKLSLKQRCGNEGAKHRNARTIFLLDAIELGRDARAERGEEFLARGRLRFWRLGLRGLRNLGSGALGAVEGGVDLFYNPFDIFPVDNGDWFEVNGRLFPRWFGTCQSC